MPPRDAERRPRARSGALETAQLGDSGNHRVTRTAVIPHPRAEHARSWCPCGCLTDPPYFDDSDCIRHLPTPEPREWGGYDVAALGLLAHDRAACASCQAVGA